MKDQNVLKKLGLPWTDRDFIETWGLDPQLEGSPQINNAMYDLVEEQTTTQYVKDGMAEAEARKIAKANKVAAIKNHQEQLAYLKDNS